MDQPNVPGLSAQPNAEGGEKFGVQVLPSLDVRPMNEPYDLTLGDVNSDPIVTRPPFPIVLLVDFPWMPAKWT